MSREIKFRAWNEELEEMYKLRKANYLGSTGIIDPYIGGDKSIWQQYTGLKDKNGVEIYEGDIIRDVDNRTHTVIYERGMFGCYKTWLVSYETGERRKSIESLNNFLVDEVIVIGNIYENPELLEATK